MTMFIGIDRKRQAHARRDFVLIWNGGGERGREATNCDLLPTSHDSTLIGPLSIHAAVPMACKVQLPCYGHSYRMRE